MKKIILLILALFPFSSFAESGVTSTGETLNPLYIESHSLSYHVFAFALDWMNFFMGNIVWLLFLIFGLATVGLFVGGFLYYSYHR